MKKIVVLTAVLAFLYSCGSKDRGELVGVKGKKWHPEKPYGMTLVPGGSFIMGKSDDDIAQTKNAPTKTVTVPSFYMDETEITNSEYREFVYWVRDSIIRTRLAILADEEGKTDPATDGIAKYAFKDADTANLTEWEKYNLDKFLLFHLLNLSLVQIQVLLFFGYPIIFLGYHLVWLDQNEFRL